MANLNKIRVIKDGITRDYEVNGSGGTPSEIYSLDEQVIGQWINGKPLYRKVIHLTSGWTLDAETVINHNIADVDEIWIDKAFFKRSDNKFQLIPNMHSNMSWWGTGIFDISSSSFTLWFGSFNSLFTINYIDIIFNYTKTTDVIGGGE